MAIGEGKHLKATGIIKKVFPHKSEPYGFLLLLTPLELRGQEASFFCCDLKVPADEREHLRVGMQLEFNVIDKPADNMKSIVDFKAVELSPLTPSCYQAAVVRPPGEHGKGLRVATDLTLEQVKISAASYLKLNQKLVMGDPCVIQLTWKELISATKEKRPLEGEIVSACRLRLPLRYSQEEAETGTEETIPSSEDSLPEKPEQCRRGLKSTPKKVKEPLVRTRSSSLSKSPTTPKLLNRYESDYRCDGFKQESRCCSSPSCQDQGSFLASKIPPFPLPTFNAPCLCSGCLIMRQNYSMIPPGCLPFYPAVGNGIDVGAPSWPSMDGC